MRTTYEKKWTLQNQEHFLRFLYILNQTPLSTIPRGRKIRTLLKNNRYNCSIKFRYFIWHYLTFSLSTKVKGHSASRPRGVKGHRASKATGRQKPRGVKVPQGINCHGVSKCHRASKATGRQRLQGVKG